MKINRKISVQSGRTFYHIGFKASWAIQEVFAFRILETQNKKSVSDILSHYSVENKCIQSLEFFGN